MGVLRAPGLVSVCPPHERSPEVAALWAPRFYAYFERLPERIVFMIASFPS